jgi:hypothetical protein
MSNPAPSVENTELSEILALGNLKGTLALAKLNAKLHELNEKDFVELTTEYSTEEIVEVLKLIQLMRDFECGYNEVYAGLRLRKRDLLGHARYHQKHREEANQKNSTQMRSQYHRKRAEIESESPKIAVPAS